MWRLIEQAGWPNGPVIETGRLRLRPHRLDDLEARMAMTADLDVMRFIGGIVQDEEENWARLFRYAGHWALLGRGLFAVEERATGCFVGELGFADFHRGLGKDFDGAFEAAWVLNRSAAGRGYAHEAMRAVMGWHSHRFGEKRMVCLIAPDNAPSLRLAAKLGFTPFRDTIYRGRPAVLLERLAATPVIG